jgi:hypothetical protein
MEPDESTSSLLQASFRLGRWRKTIVLSRALLVCRDGHNLEFQLIRSCEVLTWTLSAEHVLPMRTYGRRRETEWIPQRVYGWDVQQSQNFLSDTLSWYWMNSKISSAKGLCSASDQHFCMKSHRISPMYGVTGRAGFLPLRICTTTWWSLRHSEYGTFPVKI